MTDSQVRRLAEELAREAGLEGRSVDLPIEEAPLWGLVPMAYVKAAHRILALGADNNTLRDSIDEMRGIQAERDSAITERDEARRVAATLQRRRQRDIDMAASTARIGVTSDIEWDEFEAAVTKAREWAK